MFLHNVTPLLEFAAVDVRLQNEHFRSLSFNNKGINEVPICQKRRATNQKRARLNGADQDAVLQGKTVIHPVGEVDIVGDHYG